jgi:hypothetical protein
MPAFVDALSMLACQFGDVLCQLKVFHLLKNHQLFQGCEG